MDLFINVWLNNRLASIPIISNNIRGLRPLLALSYMVIMETHGRRQPYCDGLDYLTSLVRGTQALEVWDRNLSWRVLPITVLPHSKRNVTRLIHRIIQQ